MGAANIIAQGEQADVLSGARRFNVDEYMAIAEAGILRKEDRVELDGRGDNHYGAHRPAPRGRNRLADHGISPAPSGPGHGEDSGFRATG